MAKELEQKDVTFYLLRLDGELNTRETTITYPFSPKSLGRTKDEDTYDESYNIIFTKGSITLPEDDFRVEWMRIYNTGGKLKCHDEKIRTIQPSPNMFKVTEEDPFKKVKEITKIETVREEVAVLPKSFVETLEVDQIESWMQTQSIDVPQKNRTREGLIEILTAQGRIK